MQEKKIGVSRFVVFNLSSLFSQMVTGTFTGMLFSSAFLPANPPLLSVVLLIFLYYEPSDRVGKEGLGGRRREMGGE